MKKVFGLIVLLFISFTISAQSKDTTVNVDYAVKDNQLQVTKTTQKVDVVSYDYKRLLSQKESIQAQKDRDDKQRDIELKEIDALIQKAKDNNLDVVPADPEP